jgi:tRNA(Arg) A34 adenosine deaminase TadA
MKNVPTGEAEALMRLAVDAARRGIQRGQSPFGCAISLDGMPIAVVHNRVFASTDITAHAEITALREACSKAGRIHLQGAIVASTCEPCPMCMSALHWARVDRVYCGATIEDATDVGFNELRVSAAELIRLGGSPVHLVQGILAEECRALFAEWRASPAYHPY